MKLQAYTFEDRRPLHGEKIVVFYEQNTYTNNYVTQNICQVYYPCKDMLNAKNKYNVNYFELIRNGEYKEVSNSNTNGLYILIEDCHNFFKQQQEKNNED